MSRSYGQFAAVYDLLMEDMPYADWLGFARESWSRYGIPSTVVDLGCGTGSLSIPLARSGFQVYGIDLSSDMLAVARGKWDETPQTVTRPRTGTIRWLQQDMREWELQERVDAVISFCDCLNYLTEEVDVEAAFRATYAGLRSGGTFLFDMHPPKQLIRYAEEQPFVLDERDVAYIWTCDFERERCEIEHHLTIFAREGDAKFYRFEETHVQRAYDPEWIVSALRRAGFTTVDRYADFELRPADADSERLFFAAVK
ncbi:class I SAM-dependent DNA methyltransferase [Paenibacillus arenilitoris]|uniref:Class I SAM-dependent methyltransferase n=1 Tax=Paenibacillus arenilitoris TaxID=2772299 RepID=A0A927CWC7_9BACL|nr:class I SAM-dependent methyltransferase [Paenibacillus arenilitoris]MBD2872725.1 class I SAM-dependent methyltransferase [Paenibacillus arenilitoris]